MLLSTQSVNVAMLMVTYGIAGGFGMGLVYLESVVLFQIQRWSKGGH